MLRLMSHEPASRITPGVVHYFTASSRSGDCEACGARVEEKTPHRHWVDMSGSNHLRCMDEACTPTLDERSEEIQLWRPAWEGAKEHSPRPLTLRFPRVEVCSRCGVPLHPGASVLYFAMERGMGKDVLCDPCGDWYLFRKAEEDEDG